jgi:hypothetical protein
MQKAFCKPPEKQRKSFFLEKSRNNPGKKKSLSSFHEFNP